MMEFDVKNIVFSSTAATYGNAVYTPIDEKHPQIPINPYGKSKLMIENIMDDYDKSLRSEISKTGDILMLQELIAQQELVNGIILKHILFQIF